MSYKRRLNLSHLYIG